MKEKTKNKRAILPSERVVQVCLFLFSAIALFGGSLQMYLGQPDTTPRLDNIHRFMAGIYLACGIITFWMALNIRNQKNLVFLIVFGVMLGGTGRLISMNIVGLPEPNPLWLTYVLAEFIVPLIILIAHVITSRKLKISEQIMDN